MCSCGGVASGAAVPASAPTGLLSASRRKSELLKSRRPTRDLNLKSEVSATFLTKKAYSNMNTSLLIAVQSYTHTKMMGAGSHLLVAKKYALRRSDCTSHESRGTRHGWHEIRPPGRTSTSSRAAMLSSTARRAAVIAFVVASSGFGEGGRGGSR